MPALKGLSDVELKDNMPNILAGMADYLAAANSEKAGGRIALAGSFSIPSEL